MLYIPDTTALVYADRMRLGEHIAIETWQLSENMSEDIIRVQCDTEQVHKQGCYFTYIIANSLTLYG